MKMLLLDILVAKLCTHNANVLVPCAEEKAADRNPHLGGTYVSTVRKKRPDNLQVSMGRRLAQRHSSRWTLPMRLAVGQRTGSQDDLPRGATLSSVVFQAGRESWRLHLQQHLEHAK